MSVVEVVLTADVYYSCLTQALSTEKEEIMGLLLGDTENSSDGGGLVTVVWSVVMLPRSERKKDRVEIEPEALVAATARAEEVARLVRRKTRVIGWYHSHPHITALSSHVDLRTQGELQNLDAGWVGLIFSVFNISMRDHTSHIQLHAFQSQLIPADVTMLEHQHYPSQYVECFLPIQIVSDSNRAAWKAIFGEGSHPHSFHKYSDVLRLQQLYRHEERALLDSRCQSHSSSNSSSSPSDFLLQLLYNACVYQKSLLRGIQCTLTPLAACLQLVVEGNKERAESLQKEEQRLLMQLQALQQASASEKEEGKNQCP